MLNPVPVFPKKFDKYKEIQNSNFFLSFLNSERVHFLSAGHRIQEHILDAVTDGINC